MHPCVYHCILHAHVRVESVARQVAYGGRTLATTVAAAETPPPPHSITFLRGQAKITSSAYCLKRYGAKWGDAGDWPDSTHIDHCLLTLV